MFRKLLVAAAAVLALLPVTVQAAPDEIVVFTDEFEKQGEVGYELHLNYASRARRAPDYAGEQAPHRVFRVMPEIVVGLSENWNFGIHFPMSYDRNTHQATFDGIKARMHYLKVNEYAAESTFFYGANFELTYYDSRISESRYTGEVRGIVGTRQGDWRFTLNPILNQALSSNPGGRHVDLDVFGQVMRELGGDVAVGFEHYSSLGPVRNTVFGPASDQISYLVAEFKTKNHFEFHVGVGHGWTAGANDKRVFKALIGLPF